MDNESREVDRDNSKRCNANLKLEQKKIPLQIYNKSLCGWISCQKCLILFKTQIYSEYFSEFLDFINA